MEVEVEEEVADWLLSLGTNDFIVADRHIELLHDLGHMLRMPHSRHLGDGLLELRFTMSRNAWRITYWFAPNEIIVLLISASNGTTSRPKSVVLIRSSSSAARTIPDLDLNPKRGNQNAD